jgi:ribosomal protein S18 acetylase RimI-like enzyme
MPMFVAKVESEIVGFLSLNFHNKYTAEIHVMGVLPDFHRKKMGKELVRAAEKYLGKKGYTYLSVKTLSESRPNEEYDQTRNFYYGVGFLPVEEFKTLWGEHNPCLLLIKNLKPTTI